jgi:hypothetical protein
MKNAKKRTTEVFKFTGGNKSHVVYVTPGARIEVHTHDRSGFLLNVSAFAVGDEAEYDSFNLKYTAPIAAITAKSVVFDLGNRGRRRRLSLRSFASRNANFDRAAVAEYNAKMSRCI